MLDCSPPPRSRYAPGFPPSPRVRCRKACITLPTLPTSVDTASSSKAPLSPTGLPKHNWQLSRPSRPSRRAHDIQSQSQSSQRSCQIIIHMRTRVGQIATARATQSAARRNLRLSPRTAHALLHVATGISPVSRRVSSFPSPSGRRCTAAGARSHSPCGP